LQQTASYAVQPTKQRSQPNSSWKTSVNLAQNLKSWLTSNKTKPAHRRIAAKKRQPEIAAAAASRANSRGGFAYVRGTKKNPPILDLQQRFRNWDL